MREKIGAIARVLVLIPLAWLVPAQALEAGLEMSTRCGWFDNPSPQNVWFHDRDGEWAVGIQGGHQAKGDWPRFGAKNGVHDGPGSYGYGCACLRVSARAESMTIEEIHHAKPLPLARCRKDVHIKGSEPKRAFE